MSSSYVTSTWPLEVSLRIITSFLCGLVVMITLLKHILFNSTKPSRSHYYELPPGPKPWPVVGNLPEMLLNTVVKKMPKSRWFHDIMNRYETDIACVRLGKIHVILVRSSEIAREFLIQKDKVFSSRPFNMTTECTSRGFLTTIVTPEGEQWRKMRKLVSMHVIHPAMKLPCMRQKRDEEADNLVRFVYNQCKAGEGSSAVVNVRVAAGHYTGNAIRKMLFGRRYFGAGREDGGPGVEEEEQVEAALKVLQYVYAFSPSDYNAIFRMLDLDGHGKMVREAMRNITKYQDPVIDERVKQWKDGDKTEPEDMLDHFILAKDSTGHHLSTQEIKAQCAEIFFVTMLNPPNILEWTVAEMINQPEILLKAVQEIDAIVGKERLVQESDLSSFRYIKACVRESFRLHPVSPFLPHHASTEDATLSGYFIPKGSHIILSRKELGRSPTTWDEPLKYNPERHLNNDDAEVKFIDPDLKFISFGRGRRGCVGVGLGSIMVMMALTRLLQAFSWGLPSDMEKTDFTESDDTLFLVHPLQARVKLRLDESVYPI